MAYNTTMRSGGIIFGLVIIAFAWIRLFQQLWQMGAISIFLQWQKKPLRALIIGVLLIAGLAASFMYTRSLEWKAVGWWAVGFVFIGTMYFVSIKLVRDDAVDLALATGEFKCPEPTCRKDLQPAPGLRFCPYCRHELPRRLTDAFPAAAVQAEPNPASAVADEQRPDPAESGLHRSHQQCPVKANPLAGVATTSVPR